MKRIALTLALLTATAMPVLAFPSGTEVPTLTWPEPVASQSCADPVALMPTTCSVSR